MLFCIFSFNRGRYLQNCVNSIERCAPGADIAIFDDNSDDADTATLLADLAKRYTVVQPEQDSYRRLGGLYGNMQKALVFAQERGADMVCYLQDDTQMVRPLSEQDEQQLAALFSENENTGFVHPCFLRGRNRVRDERYMRYEESVGVYYRQGARQSAGTHFSALLIMQPARLLARGWSFLESEPRNDEQAARLFGPMPYLHVPFAMWLPEVPTYRGKRKTWALKIAERQRNSGYFPFRILDAAETAALEARPHERPPFAEDALQCVESDPPKPWAYHPMQDSRWLQKLSSVENALRRWLRF
ncbi:glycosyltransferase [Alcanivorax sp. JB21]|uniref:glycosyltransferase n=1 Tax=Alcanivorax limicola TaxID=2874102 RepID=UPI001CBE5F24|nr:glycosyltransferase [Alcanivorax limicola]MBZ2188705.1 glycosyltransferase [Alcanivorax limicola]